MRFVVDAQLPKSLSDLINSKGYDNIHTLDLPKANAIQDHEILELCIRENRVVITKDNDFLDSYLLIGKPKKLIFVKTGNMKNPILLDLFETNFQSILAFIEKYSLIEIHREEIITHE
jgi:predicted nuclease of predicted toxin-antitoxin system